MLATPSRHYVSGNRRSCEKGFNYGESRTRSGDDPRAVIELSDVMVLVNTVAVRTEQASYLPASLPAPKSGRESGADLIERIEARSVLADKRGDQPPTGAEHTTHFGHGFWDVVLRQQFEEKAADHGIE